MLNSCHTCTQNQQEMIKPAPIHKIFQAYKRIQGISRRTPIQLQKNLSATFNTKIYLKREDTNITKSYKIRGILNQIILIKDLNKDVVFAINDDVGNSIAYACQFYKIKALIFVPISFPQYKIQSLQKGNEYIEIIQQGANLNETEQLSKEFSLQNDKIYLSQFSEDTIAGYSTVAVELFEDIKEQKIDYLIFASINGVLASALAGYSKLISPETILIVAESLKNDEIENKNSEQVGNFQGIYEEFSDIKNQLSNNNCEEWKNKIDKFYQISDGLCCKYISIMYDEGIVLNPSSAYCLAALELLKDEIQNKVIVCVIAGTKNDLSMMSQIKTISEVYMQQTVYFLIYFFRKQGAIKEFLSKCIGEQDEIIRIEYTRKHNREIGPTLVGIQTTNVENLKIKLKTLGIDFQQLQPEDELFKLKV